MRITLALNGLTKSRKSTMEAKQILDLVLEVLKTLNNMNPGYLKERQPSQRIDLLILKLAKTTQLNMEIKVEDIWVLIFGTPFQVKSKKKLTTLTIGLT